MFRSHPRSWRDFRYVYPVISRRSKGLSIGINLNPDAACSFDCVYCQVDRTHPRPARPIDLDVLRAELRQLAADHARLFEQPEFDRVDPAYRRLNDIAFSGDGEPTAVPAFPAAVEIAAGVRRELGLDAARLVLITNACYLARPTVRAALAVMDASRGEIWAKLDAGTAEHFRTVNRGRFTLQHVLDNILDAARVRPLVIQSLFLRLHGAAPPPAEVAAYVERLRWILAQGGRLKLVQLYTVARRPAEPYAAPLAAGELEQIAAAVRPVGVPVECYA